MQIKTTIRYHLTPDRVVILKNTQRIIGQVGIKYGVETGNSKPMQFSDQSNENKNNPIKFWFK